MTEFNLHPASPLARYEELSLPVFFARQPYTNDITVESQGWFMFNKLKKSESYGDLNVQTWSEAYSEMVDRMDKVREFLDTHLKSK